ncbi:MAG: VOC family protein [Planctomycetes bacterium]|nr:VOC family protein [Planctomycetota bacterium]
MTDEKPPEEHIPAYGPGSISWPELATRDLDKAKDFYSKVIGWEYAEMDMGPMGMYNVIKVGEAMCGGMMGMNGPDWGEMPSHWSYYIYVEDVDATVEKAIAAGGEKVHDAFDAPEVGRICMLKDPSGAHFYVIVPAGDTDPKPPCQDEKAVIWTELMARGFDKAKAFYETVFGWEFMNVPMPTGDPEGTYNLISLNGKSVGGAMEMPAEVPAEVPSHWMGYINVGNIEEIMSKAEAEGGAIAMPMMDLEGIGKLTQISDPTGATIGLMQPTTPV